MRPEPEVTWFCNGTKVEAGDKYKFEHTKGVYHLTVTDLDKMDAGQWRCVANNDYGQSSCYCELKVIGNYRKNMLKIFTFE